MKIGFISSYKQQCGVASYTENLVHALAREQIDCKICCNFTNTPEWLPALDCPITECNLPKTYEISSYQLFHTPFITHKSEADVPKILEYLKDRDLIHCQFETNLYHPSYFFSLIKELKRLNKIIVFTNHSSGMWPEFDIRLVDHWISHSRMWVNDCLRNSSILPMGIQFFDELPVDISYNSICSFGLGRNNDDLLRAAINNKYQYRTSYGKNEWLPLDKLVQFIKSNWVISLFYPPTGANVSSSASMLALGCERPILASATEWFSHVNYPSIYKLPFDGDLTDLIDFLMEEKNRPTIENDIKTTREMIINEKRTFKDFINNHVSLYRTLLKS